MAPVREAVVTASATSRDDALVAELRKQVEEQGFFATHVRWYQPKQPGDAWVLQVFGERS